MVLGTGDDLQKGFGQGQDVPVPVQGNVQGGDGLQEPPAKPLPQVG